MGDDYSRNVKSSRRSELTARKLAVYVVVGTLAVYLSTWVGPVAFYWSFQRQFAHAQERTALRRVPAAVASAPVAGWEYREVGGVELPFPPGQSAHWKNTGEYVQVVSEEGRMDYHRRSADFVRSLFRSEVEAVGGDAVPLPDAVSLLREIATVSPASYRFTASTGERGRYAALLLSKLRLWDDRPLRRFQLFERETPHGISVLAEFDDGSAKVLVVSSQATLIIVLDRGTPPAWKASPAPWLPTCTAGTRRT